MNKLLLNHCDVAGRRVLVRVDYNVPLNSDGSVADASRIEATLPTIRYILERGGSVVLMSHLGRPEGRPDPKLSLAPVVAALSRYLPDVEVHGPLPPVGSAAAPLRETVGPGQVVVLENLRFYPGEEHPEKAPEFVEELARWGDLYVNDAFGAAHRAHASTALITRYFPKCAAAGLLMEKEIKALNSLLSQPKRPFYAILGGSKVSSKVGVVQALLGRVDGLWIGGAMAFAFMAAQGLSIGESLCADEQVRLAQKVLEQAERARVRLELPVDLMIADRLEEGAQVAIVSITQGIPAGYRGVDIGPETIRRWTEQISDAATLFWNGPVGIFEDPRFAKGTLALAKAIARLDATTVVGGGESVAAVQKAGVADQLTHVSTGGGASLELIEHGTLPGIDALSDTT
jgi:phosphoglycerate kinase